VDVRSSAHGGDGSAAEGFSEPGSDKPPL